MAVREAMGSAVPTPDDHVREDELRILPLIELELKNGFRPIAIERYLRVPGRQHASPCRDRGRLCGESEVDRPALCAGGEGVGSSAALIEGAVRGDRAAGGAKRWWRPFHAQAGHPLDLRNIMSGFEEILTSAGLHSRLDRPPAMCFLDITGYTRLTEERGDEAAAELADDAGAAGPADLGAARRPAREMARRRRHVLLPRPRAGRGGRARDGRRRRRRRAAAGARRPPRRAGPLPGRRLLRADGQRRLTDRRVRAPGRGARQPGGRGRRSERRAFAEIGPVELKGVAGAMHLHVAHRA